MASVPVSDFTPWFDHSGATDVAAAVDRALRDVGFLLVTGHRVSPELADTVRRTSRDFLALPGECIAGRGTRDAAAITSYLQAMRVLADQLLEICAAALGLPADFFTRHTRNPTYTLNINWYRR